VSTDAESGVYALLTDGTTILIRSARPDDFDAVRELHEKMSPDSLYLRFFSLSPRAAEREARRICREPGPDHPALLAFLDGRLIGCGSYESGGPGTAEVAFTVADDMHNRGVGTLLLEHLISRARNQGLHAFTAATLSDNSAMLRVFADAGLQAQRTLADGVYDMTFPLPSGEADVTLEAYRAAVTKRERSANVASLRPALTPASIAVIGASRRERSIGRSILRNLTTGGFSGPVYAVNPAVAELEGVPCVPSVTALPPGIDLAVIATPAATVTEIAEECGQLGVRALVVVAAGLGSAARAELRGICRRHGMRMIGPASLGLANTSIGLDATFAAQHPAPGRAGLAVQSTGGLGFALLEHLSQLGIGISSLVSLGDEDDVSGEDALLWWESDPATKLAVLYLASIDNPPKFARTARRVGRSIPVLTVTAGRSATGRRLAGAAGAAATPMLTRQALFEQAGVIATANLGELLDTAALLASQPAPAGRRVAGLQVAVLTEDTQRALRELLPAMATVTGPVDTTVMAGPGLFRRCLELAGADPGVNAVLALTAKTAGGDPVPEVAAARLPVPIAAAVLDQVEVVRLLTGPDDERPAVPAYAYPESAARSLAHAARYGAWRAIPPGTVPSLSGVDEGRARDLVAGFLSRHPDGGWLPLSATAELLGSYGIVLAGYASAATEDAAAAAAARFSVPVALRADVPGLVRKREAGAVLTGLPDADEVRRGFRSLQERFGHRLAGVIVQPMVTGGVELKVSVVQERVVGPLVLFGLSGATGRGLADRAARLAPLTDADADQLIRSIPAARLIGRHGARIADLAALRDLLLRVSQMADDLPQIAELELSPVVARPDGVHAIDARIRLRPAAPEDTDLRRLR
jgi:acyl-CoA synthetase (NDP forming)/RimJ/RimL family protein N-acetyltransferase